ncbi:claspin [Holotrichia oblita]|uniref:Claspin n=1 Tax=Holotrichia oblita TaxID=644536 RepID=A0ACB9TLW1_HOLOL|nr:claspin [Holotrichia oblita]
MEESDNRSRFLAICDPDDSESELNLSTEESYSEPIVSEGRKKYRNKKLKPISDIDDQRKQLTGRDAAKLKKEIQSESQRMTRESTISLPYHKPKARTLKEFLQNRSRFATAVPSISGKTPPSLALKMSTDQLKAISEKLSAREREIKQFFKSNSDSEEENPMTLNKTDSKQISKIDILENDAGLEEGIKTPVVCVLQNILLNECTDSEIANSCVNENSVKEREESDELIINSNDTSDERDILKISDNNTAKTVNSENNATNLSEIQENTNSIFKKAEVACVEEATITTTNSNNINDSTTMAAEINKNKDNIVDNELNEIGSPEFQFSMSGVDFEDESQDGVAMEDKINKLIAKYTTDEVLNDISRESVLNTKNVNEHSRIENPNAKSILHLVKEKLGNFKPQLHGSRDHIIDLDSDTTQVNEISQLMNRFVKHNKKISPQKHKVKLDVVSLSDGKVHKETVEMAINGEETIPVNEKPGERLKRLREELQTQMAQKRSEIWQRRTKLNTFNKEDVKEENSNCNEIENDVLDNEDEEEFTESEEEDDVIDACEKNEEEQITQKCDFLDEEAEESDIDNDDIELMRNDNMLEENDQEDETSNEENEHSQDDFRIRKKRKLKRIIKSFSNESEDEESSVDSDVNSVLEKSSSNLNDQRNNEGNNLDSTSTWEEYCSLTPNQPRKTQTPIRKETQSKSELGFLTPVVQLTGLQSLNSGSKFLHESPISPFVIPPDSSPTKSQTQTGPQKRLFTDIDLTSTQELSEVAELCSGVFPSQSQELENTAESESISKSMPVKNNEISNENTTLNLDVPSTQDLLEICSGKFTGITQPEACIEIKNNTKDGERSANSDFTSISTLNQKLTEISTNHTEIKNLDTEDKLITELLNDEEMENFKRRFESPTDADTSTVPFGRVIYDSSDEETSNKMKKKKRKLIFSDNEDSEENENSDEEIDLYDGVSEDENSNTNVQNIEYDSEENEIELDVKNKSIKMKITDFLENEAELSESEWGSADEDERGLDELELEDGDNEKLDEEQVKRDLERIHMRRVLDDDNHEVKILQELLLDDGEMYGNGRERQFRWKNIDSLGNEPNDTKPDDGEVYLDEDENEEKWRKMRYEREVFLKKQLERSQSLDLEENIVAEANSQIMKLGQKAIKRSISASQNDNTTIQEKKTITTKLLSTSLLTKRGSFLTRSDQVLQRVAEFTRTLNADVGSTKNSKKFIFNVVSESTNLMDKKRKASNSTPTAIKKLRLDHLSPSVQNNNKKEIFSKLNF